MTTLNRAKLGIISFGLGNIRALSNMLLEIGYESDLVSDPNNCKYYDLLFLPGVGSFDGVVSKLESSGFFDAIKSYVDGQGALIGICAGMQVLFNASSEGSKSGLCILNGQLEKFNTVKHHVPAVPHMQWSHVTFDVPIFDENGRAVNRFYFVHSYFLSAANPFSIGITKYNKFRFCSIVRKGNVVGFQFHPEKSHRHGKFVLKHFIGELIAK